MCSIVFSCVQINKCANWYKKNTIPNETLFVLPAFGCCILLLLVSKMVFTLCIALVVLFCYQWAQQLHLQSALPATCTGGVFLAATSTFTSAQMTYKHAATTHCKLHWGCFPLPTRHIGFTFVIRKLYLVCTEQCTHQVNLEDVSLMSWSVQLLVAT